MRKIELRRQDRIINKIDWLTIFVFFILVVFGWMNIAASVYDKEIHTTIFSLDLNSGKQLLWIGLTILIIIVIMTLDYKMFESLSYITYGFTLLLLILVLLFGREISGSKSWFQVAGFGLQPAEFAKFATALAVAKYMGDHQLKLTRIKDLAIVGTFIAAPMLLIMLQPDAGTTMVFAAFAIVLYREGLSPAIILIGIFIGVLFVFTLFFDELILYIALVILTLIALGVIIGIGERVAKRVALVVIAAITVSVAIGVFDYIVTDVFKPHQQARIKSLIDPQLDPRGVGYHVIQSKIAIGSGGPWGKGFLQGTQTQLRYVPEQSTDFIFCTIGEEHGWVGSSIVILLFIILLFRIIDISERQKSRFVRVYGYSVASIIFFHFMVNVGMTIGMFPIVGIPLPFFSYGGSSLWAFTILLFILIKLDAHRMQILR
jgi:rod shape determining protein RodA